MTAQDFEDTSIFQGVTEFRVQDKEYRFMNKEDNLFGVYVRRISRDDAFIFDCIVPISKNKHEPLAMFMRYNDHKSGCKE